MKINYPLKDRQICFFVLAFLPITKIFSLPSLIAGYSNEDMWISALINLLIDFLTLIPIVIACKKSRTGFFELMENTFGKLFSKVILFLYFIYFMLKAILPLNEQKDYIDYTLYTLRPTIAYFIPFFIVAFYLCFKRLKVLGRLSDILWFISLNGFITLFALSLTNAEFSAILPIGANTMPNILLASFKSLNWFGDAVFIMFFIGEFEYKKGFSLKLFLSYLVSALMVILFMIIFYSIFTSISHRQRFALTEISKYTTVINNLGRFDYIGIIMIIFSNTFALCLPMFFSAKILNHLFNIQKIWIAPAITVGLQLLIMLVFNEYFVSIQNFIIDYVGWFFLIFSNILPVIISLLIVKENNYATKKS